LNVNAIAQRAKRFKRDFLKIGQRPSKLLTQTSGLVSHRAANDFGFCSEDSSCGLFGESGCLGAHPKKNIAQQIERQARRVWQ
jgi:hypothetical protein